MHAATDPPGAAPAPFEHVPPLTTQPRHAIARRERRFRTGLFATPLVAGVAVALASRRHELRRGVLAGAVTALALGAVRWQLARWFTDEPAHEREATIGALELRRYPARLEARVELEAQDVETALTRGFGHLACYLHGANDHREDLAMTTPVLTTMRGGRYAMSFVMPPGRALATLPRPADPRIELREVPARRVAVLRFRGRFTRENIETHERAMLRELVEAGLAAKGSVAFAGYDSPMTLPALRRNELWIEIV